MTKKFDKSIHSNTNLPLFIMITFLESIWNIPSPLKSNLDKIFYYLTSWLLTIL